MAIATMAPDAAYRADLHDEKPRVNRKGIPATGEDPVLVAIEHTHVEYLKTREDLINLVEDLQQTQAAARQMKDAFERVHRDLDKERQRAAKHKERAIRLTDALRNVHRAVFEGNVFAMILKACLQITGATRGLYLTAWDHGELRPRASVDVDGYPSHAPSSYLQALCGKVMDGQDTFVANSPEGLADLPPAESQSERFTNCLVAPVVLLKNFNGIIVLADKLNGDFDEDDVDTVLSVGKQAAAAVENQKLQSDLVKAYFSIVGILADAVEVKDAYTYGHSEQVALFAKRIAERMGVSRADISVVCYGGLLHDIGKIGISDGVLNKPGKLLPEEWELMRSHVRIGRDLLSRVPALSRVADVVFHHHERYDGGGYPDGLRGDAIGLASRIVCVADAYCAMIAKRSYKESFSEEQARAELINCKSTHFDPQVVETFLQVLQEPGADFDECPDGCGIPPDVLPFEEFQLALDNPVVATVAKNGAKPKVRAKAKRS